MKLDVSIPSFGLFGEPNSPSISVHCEDFRHRASQNNWTISAHRHQQMVQLFYMAQGQADVALDGTSYDLGPGQFIWVPARVVHQLQFTKGSRGSVVSITAAVANAAPRTLNGIHHGRASDDLVALIGWIERAQRRRTQHQLPKLVGLAQALLSEVADSNAASAPHNSALIRQFEDLVADKLGAARTASAYAQELGISRGHLARLCRDQLGTTASAYIESAVMAEACRLLTFTRQSAVQIGERLGYADPAYFSRRFKKVIGQTAGDYRAGFFVP